MDGSSSNDGGNLLADARQAMLLQRVRHGATAMTPAEAFRLATGCPVVVNTSFNVRGEPIACTPEDSWRCFMRTEMDALVLETCLLHKEGQPAYAETREGQGVFRLD